MYRTRVVADWAMISCWVTAREVGWMTACSMTCGSIQSWRLFVWTCWACKMSNVLLTLCGLWAADNVLSLFPTKSVKDFHVLWLQCMPLLFRSKVAMTLLGGLFFILPFCFACFTQLDPTYTLSPKYPMPMNHHLCQHWPQTSHIPAQHSHSRTLTAGGSHGDLICWQHCRHVTLTCTLTTVNTAWILTAMGLTHLMHRWIDQWWRSQRRVQLAVDWKHDVCS